MPVILKKWSFTTRSDGDAYLAPELCRKYIAIQGKAYGHPRFPDGSNVLSSELISVDYYNGRPWACESISGSHYQLDDVDPEWVDWLDDNGECILNFIEKIG
jgi:hypothetical protein